MAFVHGLLTRMAPEIVNKPGYRADIDALRGLAVAGGVLFHFFLGVMRLSGRRHLFRHLRLPHLCINLCAAGKRPAPLFASFMPDASGGCSHHCCLF